MAAKVPYMISPGVIPKILGKIQEARRPERFTQDFLETKLQSKGGSARAIIPLLKRLGMLSSDGVPTERYDKFRNEHTQGRAMAEAMREGFKEIFDRNEFAGDLTKDRLQAMITEITGLEKDNRTVQASVSTFFALREFADFDASADEPEHQSNPSQADTNSGHPVSHAVDARTSPVGGNDVGLNLSYTINLNLPETSDPEVFNAIFKALRENLLEK